MRPPLEKKKNFLINYHTLWTKSSNAIQIECIKRPINSR